MSELIDITHKEHILTHIYELYSNDLNKETLGYSTLKNYLDWLKKVPNLAHTKIYTYGDWHKSGLYLIVDRFQLMASSMKPNDDDLGSAMKLLDWNSGYSIFPVAELQHDVVLKTLLELKAPAEKVELLVLKLPRDKALSCNLNSPTDYEVSTLTTDDVDFIDSLYLPRYPTNAFYLSRIIDLNVSVALRSRVHGKLVAWCTRCFTGLLSTLQVIEEYQRRGLASFVICQFAKKIAALGEDVWTAVRETNQASLAVFEKMGFERCGKVHFFPAYDESEAQLSTKD